MFGILEKQYEIICRFEFQSFYFSYMWNRNYTWLGGHKYYYFPWIQSPLILSVCVWQFSFINKENEIFLNSWLNIIKHNPGKWLLIRPGFVWILKYFTSNRKCKGTYTVEHLQEMYTFLLLKYSLKDKNISWTTCFIMLGLTVLLLDFSALLSYFHFYHFFPFRKPISHPANPMISLSLLKVGNILNWVPGTLLSAFWEQQL